jgi:hypothetical protein
MRQRDRSNAPPGTAQPQLSSPGLTGRPSIPEALVIDREAAAYWITRSSRVMTDVGSGVLDHPVIGERKRRRPSDG